MKLMGIKMKKYLKIIEILWSMSLQTMVEYRTSFILTTLSIALWLLIDIGWIYFVYRLTDTFAGLSIWQYILFLGIYFFWINFYWFLFTLSLGSLSKFIYEGELDKWLVKPIDSQFTASVRGFDIPSLGNSIFGIVTIIVALFNLQVDASIANVALAFIILCLSFVAFYSIIFIIFSYTFWAGRMTALEGFIDSFVDSTSSIPANAYTGIIRIIIYFIIPVAMITSIPLNLIFFEVSWQLILYYFIFTTSIALLARYVWKMGLKSYTSVSG